MDRCAKVVGSVPREHPDKNLHVCVMHDVTLVNPRMCMVLFVQSLFKCTFDPDVIVPKVFSDHDPRPPTRYIVFSLLAACKRKTILIAGFAALC